ncbi:MAG: FHA domain-containing protein [Polyangia bacterium]|jgi:hypothetical protein|nr:FHA domain-containing protein [Polyangia bacterium]
MATTVLLRVGNSTATLDALNPNVLIGRDAGHCNLVIEDASVSRRHAEVYLEGGVPHIRDLGSSNGTWVNGQPLQYHPAALQPGQQIYVGHVPMAAEWSGAAGGGATVMGGMPPDLLKQMQAQFEQARKQGFAAPGSAPAAAAALHQSQAPAYAQAPGQPSQQAPAPGGGGIGLGGLEAPVPAEYTYRRQGSNNNGVLLIALKQDTFANDQTLDGYLEYTATDNETVASITIELVECHKKGPKQGHVWDRMLVRQGPWKSRKGDVLPAPFQLRVPPGTSITGRDVHWELRGYVDINWALDVEATCPISMRNLDVERIRDSLGALDYRIVEMDPEPLGQHYKGKFQPPAQFRKELGIANVNLDLEYLGTNLKVVMKVEKTSLFKFDRKVEFVFELGKLRVAPLPELSAHFKTNIDQMMAR